MMLPGVIAFHLYGPGLESMDDAYPRLAKDVLPAYLSGFFLAVLLGAVLSSFNSLLNSASTLFAVDLYQPIRPDADDARLIRVARVVGTVLALFSFLIAPLLQYAPEGVWQLIRKFTGFYNIPIIAIVVMAVLTSRTAHRGTGPRSTHRHRLPPDRLHHSDFRLGQRHSLHPYLRAAVRGGSRHHGHICLVAPGCSHHANIRTRCGYDSLALRTSHVRRPAPAHGRHLLAFLAPGSCRCLFSES